MGLHCAAYRNGSRIPFRFRRGGLHKSVAPSNHEYVESQLSNEIDNRINLRSRVTYILISKLRTKLWILLLMPLYVQSFIRYWKDSKSRDLPYHSFSKMQLIYLVTRSWKIFWSTLLSFLKTETLWIYIHIRFDQVWSERIENNFTGRIRAESEICLSLVTLVEREGRNKKSKNKRQRKETAFPWRRLSVIVTSAFQGNESRSTEVTVPLIERPAPPGSRPFPNNLVPIPSPLLLSLSSRAHSTPLTIVQSLSLSFSSRILFRNREERLKAGLMNYRFFSGR